MEIINNLLDYSATEPWSESAIPDDQPVMPSIGGSLPPPGPDFLAEVDRTFPNLDEEIAKRTEGLLVLARHDLTIPVGLGEAWVKQVKSKSEKQRELARKKAEKYAAEEVREKHSPRRQRLLDNLYWGALYDLNFMMPVKVKAAVVNAGFLTGHLIGADRERGPVRAEVMLIGKQPSEEELRQKRHFVGGTAEPWNRAIEELELQERVEDWYITDLVKFPPLDPTKPGLATAWIKDCLPILAAEVQLVRPKFILCLGVDSASALLGQKIKVVESRNEIYTYPVEAFGDEDAYEASVMVVPHPTASFHDPDMYDDFRDRLVGFVRLLDRGSIIRPRIEARRHVNIYKERHLAAVVDAIVAQGDSILAIDGEWEGKHWEPDAWLRTIQFSHKAGVGYTVVLRKQHGVECFTDRSGQVNLQSAFDQLNRLFKSTPDRTVRVGGHFFRADLPWLIREGIDIRDEWAPPETPQETKTKGGFDTSAMIHSVWETGAPYGLEAWACKLLNVARYDLDLDEWIKRDCKDRKVSKSSITGYGHVPDDYLIGSDDGRFPNYAALDVDVTRELFDVLNGVGDEPGYLDQDRFKLNSRGGYHTTMGATQAFLEIEMKGMLVDRDRLDPLTDVYMEAKNALYAEVREDIGWPDFNLKSTPQLRELLFGERFSGVKDKQTGLPVRKRPEGAICLGLTPIKTTKLKDGKALPWESLDEDDLGLYAPGTDKEVLGIFQSDDQPVVRKLRNLGFITKLLSYPLSVPKVDDEKQVMRDEFGHYLYEGGMPAFIGCDGRVHTNIGYTETGRVSSWGPNQQNYSSRREADYSKILGDSYLYPIRSVFRATPGTVMVKTDLKTAELVVVGYLSGDTQLLEDLKLSNLPEDHPDHRDLHAAMAVDAFRLNCPPTKAGLKSIGRSTLRTGAKVIRFSGLYGGGARFLTRQCQEEGADVTLEQVRAMVDASDARYPQMKAFLEGLAERVTDPGYLVNPFGRIRRTGTTHDEGKISKIGREFRNFMIQSTVADVVSIAMNRLMKFRENYSGPHSFDFLLQLHDELDFEVPYHSVEWFIDEVLNPTIRSVLIPVTDFDGKLVPSRDPFTMGNDTYVYEYWGEAMSIEQGRAYGIPDRFIAKDDD